MKKIDLIGELGLKGSTGLRKVEKFEMTHKNPELRTTSVVGVSGSGSGSVTRGNGLSTHC